MYPVDKMTLGITLILQLICIECVTFDSVACLWQLTPSYAYKNVWTYRLMLKEIVRDVHISHAPGSDSEFPLFEITRTHEGYHNSDVFAQSWCQSIPCEFRAQVNTFIGGNRSWTKRGSGNRFDIVLSPIYIWIGKIEDGKTNILGLGRLSALQSQ